MRIYRFGEIVNLDGPLTPAEVKAIVSEAQRRRQAIQAVSLEKILDVLDRVGVAWSSPEYAYRKQALAELPDRIGFSPAMIEQGILTMIGLLKKENLQIRLDCDLGEMHYLDGWVYHNRFGGYMLAQPMGVVAHVSAGNVFVGGVDTLIQGIVTKNVNIMKMSSVDPIFPVLFAQSVKQHDPDGIVSGSMALLTWKGGDAGVEAAIKQGCDAVVVYGGAETVRSYRQDLGLHTRLIEYGPKYSFVMVAEKEMRQMGMDQVARLIGRDVIMWEQSACSSPHVVYVESPVGESVADELAEALAQALSRWAEEIPPGGLDPDEATEITRVREMAKVERAMGQSKLFAPHGTEWTVVVQRNPEFQTSCLNRTIFLKPVASLEETLVHLNTMGAYIQTVAILADEERVKALGQALSSIGADRMVGLGQMAVRKHGTPHDGGRGLAELVRWASLACAGGAPSYDIRWNRYQVEGDDFDFMDDDARDALTLTRVKEIVSYAANSSPYYKEQFAGVTIRTLDDIRKLPILSGENLKDHVPPNGTGLLTDEASSGYVFSSGGTTGRPKVVYRTHEEQHFNAIRLGKGLALSVFGPQDLVATLLFAGSMWASFVSYTMALEHTGCRILPIAGNVDMATIVNYLAQFRANAVITIPSVLLGLAEYVEKNRTADVKIEKVSTGGEHLFEGAREYLRRILGIRIFASTGYTSNDTGAIGYQCRYCQSGVHHVHEDVHLMEIVNPDTLEPVPPGVTGKIILTNLQRRLMPTIRYDIGDMGRWIDDQCPCGRRTRLMELLGRSDDVLIIGGGNILPEVVAAAIHGTPGFSEHFQMISRMSGHLDQLLLRVESKCEIDFDVNTAIASLRGRLYESSKELRTMRDRRLIAPIAIDVLPPGGLPRNPRTGKIKLTVDERKI